MARRTRGNLRTLAAVGVKGLAAADLNATDSAILNRAINDEQEEWRGEFPGIRGFGERIAEDETWTADDTRKELPADFAELHPSMNGRIQLKDTSGNETSQLEVINVGAYTQEWRDGHNRYDDRQEPIAYLFSTSTNGRRILDIRPAPSTAIQYDLVYIAFVENLDNDADELEAPLGMHAGIEAGVAARFALYTGSPMKDEWAQERERVKTQFRDPIRQEKRRQSRFLAFDDPVVGGYRAFEYAE
jgi:hypothetical protein